MKELHMIQSVLKAPKGQFNARINIGVFSPSGIKMLRKHFSDSYSLVVVYVDAFMITRLFRSIKRDGKLRWEHLRRARQDNKDFLYWWSILIDDEYNFIYCHSESVDAMTKRVYNILCTRGFLNPK